jgi:hypothetical protein
MPGHRKSCLFLKVPFVYIEKEPTAHGARHGNRPTPMKFRQANSKVGQCSPNCDSYKIGGFFSSLNPEEAVYEKNSEITAWFDH